MFWTHYIIMSFFFLFSLSLSFFQLFGLRPLHLVQTDKTKSIFSGVQNTTTKTKARNSNPQKLGKQTDNELTQSKSTFDMTIKIARWAATSGLMLFLQFWYSKTPIFTLPPGWIPWQVQWVLSFPRAPMGTVSIQIWGGACATVVALVGDAMKASLAYVSKPKIDRIKLGATMEGKEGKKRQ